MTYRYRAFYQKNYDGDTFECRLDLGGAMRNLGIDATMEATVRILGINCDEMRGGTPETKGRAQQAQIFVQNELKGALELWVETKKKDSFRRWLARVEYIAADGTGPHDLGQKLIEAGLARSDIRP